MLSIYRGAISKFRTVILIDRGNYAYATCHVRNVCEGAILAARHGHPGQAYFLTDGDPPGTFRQFLTDLLATQGVKPGSASLPRWLAWSMAAVIEGLPLPWAPPITRAHVALIGKEVTVSDSKARRELGYMGHVSHEKGLEELAAC
jgi:nucleoside-diphosphate-sugar epimerase